VKWCGYDESENTWEPLDNLINTHALDEWEKQNITEVSAYTTEVDQSYLQTDPQSLKDILCRPDRDLWIEAMNDEIKSLQENDTWELVKRPIDRDVIGTRWVFHIKKRIDGSIEADLLLKDLHRYQA
jgi:hypothetical protein